MTNDPSIPDRELLFQPVQDAYGTRLALVFGNEAPRGLCPYYRRQCYHCDIGGGEGANFDTRTNKTRLDFFRQFYASVLSEVAHLVLYNSGSVLNPRELADNTLDPILNVAASLTQCTVVSLDSREDFITEERLKRVLRFLRPRQQPRVILGLETQNDDIRVGILNKKMTRKSVEDAFRSVSKFKGSVGLDINIVFGLPPLFGTAAIVDAESTARFSLELAERYRVPVDFNFHPYYPSRIGLEYFRYHPRANLEDALEAVMRIRNAVLEAKQSSMVFIGWQDEAHDQEPAIRHAELLRFRDRFHRFNRTQNLA